MMSTKFIFHEKCLIYLNYGVFIASDLEIVRLVAKYLERNFKHTYPKIFDCYEVEERLM